MIRHVLSPLARARWCDGEIELDSGVSPRVHRWQGGELLALLDDFARPVSISEVIAAHPEHHPDELLALLDTFRSSGVIVPEAVAAALSTDESPLDSIPEQLAIATVADALATGALRVDDGGQTVSTHGRDALSPGCQACKDGGWICSYLGFRCDAGCGFCPQAPSRGRRDEARIGTAFVPALLDFVDRNAGRVSGISVSGGELCLYRDRALAILTHAERHHPEAWRWAYTNGLQLDPTFLRALKEHGLQELRFNLAASGWSARMRAEVERAVAALPWVTVEVPSTRRTHRALLDEGWLEWLEAAGVRQLNLAQLCIPESTPDAPVASEHRDDGPFYTVAGAHYSLPSRLRSLEIMIAARARAPGLQVNDCSSDAKRVQDTARRLRWGHDLPAMLRHRWPHPAQPPGPAHPPVDAQRSPSGLRWVELQPGDGGIHPGPLDWVRVHSTGWTYDGAVFDSTWLRADDGQFLPLAQAIPGWAEALRHMTVGERRALWVPEACAYRGEPGRPAGMLRFDVELLEIVG
jgi:pyruvate formate-lyase activating enzyme-like uncharacterized protein